MSIICDLSGKVAQGLESGTGGSIVSNIANILGVLGAADIGIQLGTKGKAGLGDLPGLTDTPGIECADPNTGEVIYVTPTQWYSNGMSCAGLRNPDQDRIKKEMEDFERRNKLKREIKNSTGESIPIQHNQETLKRVKDQSGNIPNGFDDGVNQRNGIVFDYDGTALINSTIFDSFYRFGYVQGTSTHTTVSENSQQTTRSKSISRGQRTTSNFVTSTVTNSYPEDEVGFFTNTATIISGFVGFGFVFGVADVLFSKSINLFSSTQKASSRFTVQEVSRVSIGTSRSTISFQPVGVPPPGAYIITPYDPPRSHDPRDPCDSNKRKQPMPCSQCKLTPDIIKQIREIHKVVGAPRLIAGNLYNPESQIEGWGRQLYQGLGIPGIGVPCNDLIDIASATATAPYYKLGLQRFPAFVPESLVNKNTGLLGAIPKMKSLQDLSSFVEWTFLSIEEILGEWPVKFEVTDDGKTKNVDLWNISEALAELFGMQVKAVEDADQSVQWGVRAATEASKSGNAAVKALHLLTELVDFCGGIKSQGTITVDCTFTPDPTIGQTTEEMLKPSKQTLFVTNIQDGRSLLGLLLNINYWSQISGRANFQTLKNNPQTGNALLPGDVIREEKKRNRGFNKKFDEWKRKRQQPQTAIPNDSRPRGATIPDIKVIEVSRSQGT